MNSSEPPTSSTSEPSATPPLPDPGLPPVKPLTAGYIVQLFLVPGLIVLGAVLVLLVINWFNPFAATPDQFLKKLDDPNPEVRWRTASDLADVLLRNETFAADARLALGIAERLQRARKDAAAGEASLAEQMKRLPAGDVSAERKARENDRVFVQYLAGCLSAFRVPVGLSPLMELAESQDVADPDELSRRRVTAWMFLARLGERVQGFEKQKPDLQLAALGVLDEEANGDGERAKWAADALKILRGLHQGQPTLLGLDEVAARCADDADPNVRKVVAYALIFWQGSEKENETVDDTLVRLAQRPPAGSDDSPALQVCYNAATSLAMRGSARTPVAVLVEMLDEPRLLKTFLVRPPQGGDLVPDRDAVYVTIGNGLQGLETLHAKQPDVDLSAAWPGVEQLTTHAVPRLRTQAQKTLQVLKGA